MNPSSFAILSLVYISQLISGLVLVPEGCCLTKTVGPDSYTLVEGTNPVPSDCLDKCVYQRDGEAGSQICFKRGILPVTCTSKPDPTDNPADIALSGSYPDVSVTNGL